MQPTQIFKGAGAPLDADERKALSLPLRVQQERIGRGLLRAAARVLGARGELQVIDTDWVAAHFEYPTPMELNQEASTTLRVFRTSRRRARRRGGGGR